MKMTEGVTKVGTSCFHKVAVWDRKLAVKVVPAGLN